MARIILFTSWACCQCVTKNSGETPTIPTILLFILLFLPLGTILRPVSFPVALAHDSIMISKSRMWVRLVPPALPVVAPPWRTMAANPMT